MPGICATIARRSDAEHQGLPRGFALADVVGDADKHRFVVLVEVEQPGFDRVAGAVAAAEVRGERGAASFAVSQQGEQGVECPPVLGGQEIQRRQFLHGPGSVLQILCRRRIDLDDAQAVRVKNHDLGCRFLQDGL
jgi:hypothetical protein